MQWSFSDPDGSSQEGFLVELVNSSYTSVLWSSGWVSSGAQQYAVPSGVIAADGDYYIRVRVRDQYGHENTNNGNSPDPSYGNLYLRIDTTAPATHGHYIEGYLNFGATSASTGSLRFVWTYDDNMAAQSGYRIVGTNTDWAQWNYDPGEIYNGSNYHDIPLSQLAEGLWYFSVFVRDLANNWSDPHGGIAIYIDRTAPIGVTPQISNVTATTSLMTWAGFNDPGRSSGWQKTLIYLERWNGSAWERLIDEASVGNITSHTFTGLVASSTYRATYHQFDNAGLFNPVSWSASFTTNTPPTSVMSNLSSIGSLYNERPTLIMSGNDPNNDGLTFHLQIASNNDFSGMLVTSTSDGPGGWSTAVAVAPGVNVYFKPLSDLGVGVRYARVRSHDGKDWGPWSETRSFVISKPNWTDTIQDSFTGVKKIWVDELRDRIQNIWTARELGTCNFADSLTTDVTQVKAVHLTEMRSAIQTVHTILGLGPISWTDVTVIPNVTERKGKHLNELRNAVLKG
jgi:hypothetical protein